MAARSGGCAVSLFTSSDTNGAFGVTGGPDGAVWFTRPGTYFSWIGRITAAGVISTFQGPGIKTPTYITVGPDGNLWFVNAVGGLDTKGSISRITTAGVVTNFAGNGIYAPTGIAAGPDGNVWFMNDGGNSVGRITPTGSVTVFADPSITSGSGITAGPDGNVWFTNGGSNTIGRITTAGVVTAFSGPGISSPVGIAAGPDGNLWFTNLGNSTIGRVTTAGVVTNFDGRSTLPRRPYAVASGPDGNVWFTNQGSDSIGRVSPSGVVTNFPACYLCAPAGITAGPDGNMWFANSFASSIGKITPAGIVTVYRDPAMDHPVEIAAGADGNLYFVNAGNGTVARLTVAGAVTVVYTGAPNGITRGPDGKIWITDTGSDPGSVRRLGPSGADLVYTTPGISVPKGITAGPDGNLWFTDWKSNSIGRVTPIGQVSSYGGSGIHNPSAIAAGPDGNLWFTNYGGRSIGRITPTGAVTNWASDTIDQPMGIAAGPDGSMWFASHRNDSIERIGTGWPDPSAPDAPTAVSGVPGNTQVTVSWVAPASNGGSPITSYTVTAAPGGATCVWTSGPLSCTVTGLTNALPFTFTVTATNTVGTGPPSVPSAPVTPATTPGAPSAVTATAGKAQASIAWTGPDSTGGAPITGYFVTATPGGATCAWTAGPLSCTITGLTPGTAYTFAVVAQNPAGYGPASAPSNAVVPWDGSGYHPMTPTRVLDSRTTVGGWNAKLVAGSPRDLTVAGIAGVPVGASAVVLNVTATAGTVGSFLTVYPSGTPTPNASTVNFGVGQTIANLATVKVGPGGAIAFANAVGSVDVVADVVGYYDDGAGDLYQGTPPTRLLDSRTATGGWNTPLNAGAPRDLTVRQPANPAGVPATATAVIANVTVTGASAASFVSVWPSGVTQPNVSNLNFAAGQTIANLAVVQIGTNGAIRIANAVGDVDVIVDVVGYFDPTAGSRFHPIEPTRILDDRVPIGLSGAWGPGQTRALPVAGTANTNVPATATGVIANVTATAGTAGSYLTVFPNVEPVPTSSTLNFAAGETIANLATVPIPANKQIAFYNHLGNVDIIADAVGYYAPT